MANRGETVFITAAVPVLDAAAVTAGDYRDLGCHVLATAKALQGGTPGTFADPATQADFELWQRDRAAWLKKRKGG